MPRPGSGLPNIASGAAIRRSQAYASSAPPPSAQPSTAARVGSGRRCTRSKSRLLMPRSASSRPRSRSSAMSAPAAKTPPWPVSSSMRGLRSSRSHTWCSSAIIAASRAFRASGRYRVTTTRSSCSTMSSVRAREVVSTVLTPSPRASRRPVRRPRTGWPVRAGRSPVPAGRPG